MSTSFSPSSSPPPTLPATPIAPSIETSKYLYATKSHTPTPICYCGTRQETIYLHPLITCTGKKCQKRFYHMQCVGLTLQHLVGNEPWLCQECQLAQTLASLPPLPLPLPPPPRVCVCKDPPYTMGPMVQCARKAKCEVRWFHWVCVGFPEEDGGWVCEACGEGREEEEEEEEVPELAAKKTKISSGAVEDGFLNRGDEGELEAGVRGGLGKVAHHGCAVHGMQVWEDAVVLAEAQLDRVDGTEEVLEKRDGVRAAETTTPEPVAPKSTTPEATIPELTTTESTTPERVVPEHTTPTEPGYCFCGTPDTNDMIACDGKGCATEWFHFTCVGLTPETVPKGKWFCDDCAEKAVKRKRSKVAGRKRKR
ncbi:hypothetical protein PSV09DRAFT_2260183 [Bipolaris maydis]|nr:hypothetical protein J3E74DRAFT_292804 [Bipolaris maydis]KAJ6206823.1 hypothetical protein PSV09DRAFT_2260183 [Bipolaris maydis]KAJ6268653.1 hypothetical protein PSV08DRAFT_354316 [Bipolaris maydis]